MYMTIYEIKNRTQETAPYFFSRKTLSFFGQTMRMFSVRKQHDGRYKISAPMIDRLSGKVIGTTERYFNPISNNLDRE